MAADGSISISVDLNEADLEKQIKEFSNTIQQTMEKVKNAFSTAILPVEKLQEAQKKLTENITKSKQDIDSYAESISKNKTAYDESKIKLDEYSKKLNEAQAALNNMKSWVDQSNAGINEQKKVISENTKETEKYKEVYSALKNTVGENAEATIKAKAAYEESNVTLKESKDVLAELKKNHSVLNEQHKEDKKSLAEANGAYKEQESAVKSLDRELKYLEQSYKSETENLENLEESLKKTNEMIEKNSNSWNVWSKSFANIEDITKPIGESLQQIGKSMTTYVTAPLAALGTLSGKAAIDFESAFAGVRKTVDATEAEFAALESGIREMAKTLPASAVEISGVAEAAGQLGIQKENILDFTKTMIDLGESTNLSAEQAATSFARFANIMQMPQDSFDRLGSVIVDLGNNLATTEAEIVEMGMRIAGAGKQVGMTEAQVMSFAGALSSVGIEAEMGGSAFSKLLVNMQLAAQNGSKANEVLSKTGMTLRELQMYADASGADFKWLAQELGYTSAEFKNFLSNALDLENFSKVIGVTADEFKNLATSTPTQAITMFLEGLKRMGVEGESVIVTLDEMGITETRLRDAILRAANANEVFNEALALGDKAWESNTALTEEANKRYETMASRIETVRNQIVDIGITVGEKLLPFLEKGIEGVGKFADWFSKLDDSTVETAIKIGAVAAAIGPVVGAVGGLLTTVGTVSGALSVFSGAMAINTGVAITATPAMIGLAGAITGIGTAINFAQGNIGYIALAIGALVIGVNEWTRAQQKFQEEFGELVDTSIEVTEKLKTLNGEIKNNTKEFEDNVKNINLSAQANHALYDEIVNLNDELKNTTLTDEEATAKKTLLNSKIEALNKAVPNLALAFDEVTLSLNKGNTEIENQINNYEKYLKIQAAEAAYINIIKEQIEAEAALSAAREKAAILKEEIDSKNIFRMKGSELPAVKELKQAYNETTAEIAEGEKQQKNLEIQLKNVTDTLSQSKDAMDQFGDSMQKINGATEDGTDNVEEFANSYEKLLESISSVAKESSKLQSAYQTLQKDEKLSSETLLDLIDRYPKIASYIAETNDLTLDKGRVLKEVLAAEKETAQKSYEIEAERLQNEINGAKNRIEVIKDEYRARVDLLGLESEATILYKEANKENVAAERERIKVLESQLESIKSRIAAVNALELAYTGAAGKAEKLTEATAEYLESVTSVISESEGKIQQELEETTTAQLTEKKKQLESEQESADKKVKINKIALAKMKTDNAENATDRAKYEKEYNDLVLAYQTEYLKKSLHDKEKAAKEAYNNEKERIENLKYYNQISLSEQLAAWEEFYKTLEEGSEQYLAVEKEIYALQQKLQEDLQKSIIESLKERNKETGELEQYALDKSLEAVKTATDEKIKEYNREYEEKIKLIDEASQAEIKALQAQIDALNEDKTDKSYENAKKLIELNQAIAKAAMGDGDLAKAQEAYNKEVERQAKERKDAEIKAQKESLTAQIEGVKEANKQKEQLMKDAQTLANQTRDEEIAYNRKIADMEVEIASTKNEQLKLLLQEDLDNYKQAHDEKAALVKGDTAYLQFDKTIEKLEKQLGEAKTDAEKARIQKQLDEIQNFKDEFFENVTLMDQQAKNLVEQAQEEIHLNKMKEIRKQQYTEMNTTEALEAEARLLMVEGNEDAIISLLSEYNEDWKQQGKEYIGNMMSGMDEEFVNLTGYVNEAMKALSSGAAKVDTTKDTGIVEALKKDLSEAEAYIPKYRTFGETLAEAFKSGFSAIQNIPNTLAEMITGVAETMSAGITTFVEVIRSGNDEVIEVFEEYKPKWKEAGVSLIDNILEGADFNRLLDKAREAMEELQSIISGGSDEYIDVNYLAKLSGADYREALESMNISYSDRLALESQVNRARVARGESFLKGGVVIEKQEININQTEPSPSEIRQAVNDSNDRLAATTGVLA